MEQFYTKQVSKEIFEVLLNKEYPAENIPVGYFTFKEGGGYPKYAQKIPTYAEVLDWLLNKDIEITIFQDRNRNWIGLTDIKGKCLLEMISKKKILFLH